MRVGVHRSSSPSGRGLKVAGFLHARRAVRGLRGGSETKPSPNTYGRTTAKQCLRWAVVIRSLIK